MRNMSFMLTTQQVRDRTKTVTRRLGWEDLKPGTELCAVEKSQGLKKGEKVKKICVIRVTDVRRETLRLMADDADYGKAEAVKEGFPDLGGYGFALMFCDHNGVEIDEDVTRIEFEYVDAMPKREAA